MTSILDRLRTEFNGVKRRNPLLGGIWETVRGRKHPIFLEFPIRPVPRYGYDGRPSHPGLARLLREREPAFATHLHSFLELESSFAAIPRRAESDAGAAWDNGSFPVLDSLALYAFLARLNPATYLEIGYGNSTKFARRAVLDHDLRTRIVAVDPYTKAGCDDLCDQVIHETMEKLGPELFQSLQAGDILFIDGSHWVFQNSDVTVFFLDILPELPEGVWVHIHDITLPNDYGPDFVERYWSEQYMLAAYLLGGGQGVRIELANHYLWMDSELHQILAPLRERTPIGDLPMVGSSFWLRTTGDRATRLHAAG